MAHEWGVDDLGKTSGHPRVSLGARVEARMKCHQGGYTSRESLKMQETQILDVRKCLLWVIGVRYGRKERGVRRHLGGVRKQMEDSRGN